MTTPQQPEPKPTDRCFMCGAMYAAHDIIEEGTGRVGRLRIDFGQHHPPGYQVRRPLHWFELPPAE